MVQGVRRNMFWGQAGKRRGPSACVLVLLWQESCLGCLVFWSCVGGAPFCCWLCAIRLPSWFFQSAEVRRLLRAFVKQAARTFNEVLFLNQISLAKRLLSFYSWWHLTSEMTGQLYCESFNQFHDQAHWSAEFIVLLRVTFRFTFISGALMTYSALFSDIGLVAFSILVPIHKLLITQFRKRSEDVAWVCTASCIALSCVFALFKIFHQELLHCCTWRI